MVKWKETMKIEAPIERVWTLFQDENVRTIYPKVEVHELLEGNNNSAGAKHAQTYTEGSQQQRYVVETTVYIDEPSHKRKETSFEMNGTFRVRYAFTLEQLAEHITQLTYEGENKGITITGKAMLLAGSRKSARDTVITFMERIKGAAQQQ